MRERVVSSANNSLNTSEVETNFPPLLKWCASQFLVNSCSGCA